MLMLLLLMMMMMAVTRRHAPRHQATVSEPCQHYPFRLIAVTHSRDARPLRTAVTQSRDSQP